MADHEDAVGSEAMDDEDTEVGDETLEEPELDALEVQRQALESRLQINPFSYEDHLALIDVFKGSGKEKELRSARERMADVFPFTEDMWLQWLADEMEELAKDSGSVNYITLLFERAVQDYIAPEVWLKRVEFVSKREGGDDVKTLHDLYEKALDQCGEHVAEGGKIWLRYIKFEESQADGASERLLDLYSRALRIPLLESDSIFTSFEERYKDHPEFESVRRTYKNAEEHRRAYIEEMESLLAGSKEDRASMFMKYLDMEKNNKAPETRVETLYERAVSACSLDDSMWASYVEWLRSVEKDEEKNVMAVISRALRNVPWSGEVWKHKMRVLMKFDHSIDEIREVMTNAMNSGVRFAHEHIALWMTYMNALHRALKSEEPDSPEFANFVQEFRSSCQQASEFLPTIEGVTGDDLDEIFKYQACVEASLGNMDVARSIWGEILAPRNNPRVSLWLEFIYLERTHGDPKHVRKAFSKAFSRTIERDFPILCSLYRRFEMETGTVDHMDSADADIKKHMVAYKKWKKNEEEKRNQKPDQQKKNQKQKPQKKEQPAAKRTEAASAGKKRKAEPEGPERASKTPKVDNDGFKVPGLPVSSPKAKKDQLQRASGQQAEPVQKERSDENDERTVFFSNLHFSTTEEDIVAFAGDLKDAVESVDVVKDKLGKSRGFAYVLMKTKGDAVEFLKKDRQSLKGRPAFVSPCQKGEKRKPVFKFKTGEEPNKLFISNLDFGVTNEDLNEIYSKFGALVSVRIVTYRNGHSKGLAFVEFEDAAHAKRALLETDDMDVKGKKIEVAISNPPARKGVKTDDTPAAGSSREAAAAPKGSSLGGGTRARPSAPGAARGGRRTQVSFVPRALQAPREDKSSANGHKESPKMSNADFRSMLLGKK